MFRKLINYFRKINEQSVPENLVFKKSSILINGTTTDFRLDKEDRDYVEIGEKCLIKSIFTFETNCGFVKIGDNVHIGGAHFICRNSIEIKDNVTIAWGVVLYDHNSHSVFWEERKYDNERCYDDYKKYNGNNLVNKDWTNVISKPITIESKVWIGFDVTILKGVIIGEGAVVAAKSVVTKNVEAWTVVAGNPAKIVKYLPEYYTNQ